MDIFSTIYRGVEHLSTAKTTAAGGAGAGVSIAAALFIDPAVIVSWLQVASLGVGLVTGLASFVLVALKIVQQRRAMRGDPKRNSYTAT